jgi:hypothetical protein
MPIMNYCTSILDQKDVSDGVVQSTDFYGAQGTPKWEFGYAKEATVGGRNMPFVLVADDAFPLRKDITKPFSSKHASP